MSSSIESIVPRKAGSRGWHRGRTRSTTFRCASSASKGVIEFESDTMKYMGYDKQYSQRVLVTGGLGMIGSAFLRSYVDKYPETLFINLDDHREGAHEEAVKQVTFLPNYRFIKVPLEHREQTIHAMLDNEVTDVIHFAADSNVDRSIREPDQTLATNVFGTVNLLEGVKALKVLGLPFNRFVYVSTDEVYGHVPLGYPPKAEVDNFNPTNPYSASKAGGEHVVKAYENTYGIDVVITRGCNTFGPWQTPTKLIPRSVSLFLAGKPVELYGKGNASREWMHAETHISGIHHVWKKGIKGEVYNIGTGISLNGNEIATIVLKALGGSYKRDIKFVEDRPGHDMRYSIACDKLKATGWNTGLFGDEELIRAAIVATAIWYLKNREALV